MELQKLLYGNLTKIIKERSINATLIDVVEGIYTDGTKKVFVMNDEFRERKSNCI
jgi:hypothetical protein